MSRKSLEDYRFEQIKAHILDPENSPLPEEQKQIMDRVMSIAKVLDIHPVQKDAVLLHLEKYNNINRSQAYEDCRLAMRLFNTIYTFDYDFWHIWLLNDIAENIKKARDDGSHQAMKVIAMEHSNLIKALGEKPVQNLDPKLVERHNFYIPITINNQTVNVDLVKLLDLPASSRQNLVEALFTEISEIEAADIMES